MKKTLFALLVIVIISYSCNKEKEVSENLPDGISKIEVAEFMNGGGYTFLKGEENGNELWIAIREMPVEKGDVYYFSNAMEMKNFESKSLNKTFERILFVNDISKTLSAQKPAGSGDMSGMAVPEGHSKPKVDLVENINVTHVEGGATVEGIAKNKSLLNGKNLKIRGVVTKLNSGIMNRNWLHIQDGTKYEDYYDVTVTSNQLAQVGETVLIEGILAVDKDFGAGYVYEYIIENAKITVEK